MRLGILGGSFNPVHNGHIEIAGKVKTEFNLDSVLFMVANDPPHKHIASGVGAEARLEMTRLALEQQPGMAASGLELERPGKSYTIDTVGELKVLYPSAQIFYIIGADMLLNLPEWHRYRELLMECAFIGVQRPGYRGAKEAVEELRKAYGAQLELSSFEGPEISSTTVRDKVARALSIKALVPEPAASYIYENGLYFPKEINSIRKRLKETLKPSRYVHVMSTTRMAVDLAEQYDIDPEKARLAALLHDCAKVDKDEQVRLAEELGVDVSELLAVSPGIIHGPVGAELARQRYGILDEEVLDAIRYHTICRVGMTPLDKLVYLADKIEFTRDYQGLAQIREAASGSLDEGVLACMERSLTHITQGKNAQLHPTVLDAMEYIKKHRNGR